MQALESELNTLGLSAYESETLRQLKRDIKAKVYSALSQAAALNGYQFDTVKKLDSENHSENSILPKSSTSQNLNKAIKSSL